MIFMTSQLSTMHGSWPLANSEFTITKSVYSSCTLHNSIPTSLAYALALNMLIVKNHLDDFILCVSCSPPLPDLIGAIVVVFILAILYEGLKTLREFLIYLDLKNTKQYKAISTRYMQTEEEKTLLTVHEPVVKRKGYVATPSLLH